MTVRASDFAKVNTVLKGRHRHRRRGIRSRRGHGSGHQRRRRVRHGYFRQLQLRITRATAWSSPCWIPVWITRTPHSASATSRARTKRSTCRTSPQKVGSTVAATYNSGLTGEDVYVSDKVPYAYDYGDKDSDVFPLNSEHRHARCGHHRGQGRHHYGRRTQRAARHHEGVLRLCRRRQNILHSRSAGRLRRAGRGRHQYVPRHFLRLLPRSGQRERQRHLREHQGSGHFADRRGVQRLQRNLQLRKERQQRSDLQPRFGYGRFARHLRCSPRGRIGGRRQDALSQV